MSQSVNPPQVTREVSKAKHRIFDLERRLQKREREQECCGETQIFATEVLPNFLTDTYETESLAFIVEETWQRVKLTGKITLGMEGAAPSRLMLTNASIVATDGVTEYVFQASHVQDIRYAPYATYITLNVETVEDFPAGHWRVYLAGQAQYGDADGSGLVASWALVDWVTNGFISAEFGQAMDVQELWSVGGGGGA